MKEPADTYLCMSHVCRVAVLAWGVVVGARNFHRSTCGPIAADMGPHVEKPTEKSETPTSTSVDDAWATSKKGSKDGNKGRRLSRKSTETEVQKSIYDSLKGMLPQEIDGNRDEEGRTLREVVAARKRLNRTDPVKWPCGQKFYQEVRVKFQNKGRPQDLLVTDDTDGDIAPCLLQGMLTYKKSGNRAPFAGCLTLLEKASRADLVGVLRWALELRPTASAEQLKYGMDVARFITRLELQVKYAADVEVMRDWFDTLLLHVYSRTKGDHNKPSVFLKIHASLVYLVLPKEATEKIISHTGSFTKVEAELLEASHSKLGMALFGSSLHAVLDELVTIEIDAALKELFELKSISRDDVDAAQKALLEKLEGTACASSLPDKRLVKMSYRKRVFDMPVKCIMEHVEAAFACALKGAACACKELPALFCEDSLVDLTYAGRKGQIDDDVLEPWRQARERANSGLGPSKDSENILDFLAKQEAQLTSVDRTFRTDIAFVKGMVGLAGEQALEAKVLSILPDEERTVTLQKAFEQLQALQTTDLHTFCSLAAQGMVKSVLQYVQALLYGRRPAFVSNASPAMARVKLALQYFCTAKDGSTELVGTSALEHHFKVAQEKKRDDTLTLEHLEQVTRFSWLLDDEGAELLATMMAIAMAKTKQDLGTAVQKFGARKRELGQCEGSASGSASSKKAKGGDSSASSEISAAMAMFRGGSA